MRTYTMPYGVYDDTLYDNKNVTRSPITPMDTFQGEDYLSGAHFLYPTPQSLPSASSIARHANPHSPAMYQAHEFNLQPMAGRYSSSSSSIGSPLTYASAPAHCPDMWAHPSTASASCTPASEINCFEFEGTVARPHHQFEDFLPDHGSCNFVDPSNIHSAPPQTLLSNFGAQDAGFSSNMTPYTHMQSHGSFAYHSNQLQRSRSRSPGHSPTWHRSSPNGSTRSVNSGNRSRTSETDEDGKVRKRCPYPDCGKLYKDLKAHMLTHQEERPEKCPIKTCEFNKRGFARKYDRNRHLVTTHYKATIVCGFCPGSGTSTEKTFNRTDVFKRHLLSVHCVEQTPSNRKKSPTSGTQSSPAGTGGATGRCSTCGNNFTNAQELFNHLDDCVLRVVQETNPIESNNERLLAGVADDEEVKYTFERNNIVDSSSYGTEENSEELDEEEESLDLATIITTSSSRSGKSAISYKAPSPPVLRSNVLDGRIKKPTLTLPRAGLTWSKKGMTLPVPNTLARKRKDYPTSWGMPADSLNLKKRVLCVFDGQRRLWKDELMMNNDYEVRVDLGADGQSYVTDLDVETLKRAEGVLGATEAERGPWCSTNVQGLDVESLLA